MKKKHLIAKRFRGFLPVVIDVETAGFNAQKDALLEIGAVIIDMDNRGKLLPGEKLHSHVLPFEGANINPKSLEFNGITDPYHPFRFAETERQALENLFIPVRQQLRKTHCSRAILVGHNAFFDLGFINAATERTGLKSPFHLFSTFDTVSLGGMAFGHTVLAKVARVIGLPWDDNEAHSAIYDAERTAEIFCHITNKWTDLDNHWA